VNQKQPSSSRGVRLYQDEQVTVTSSWFVSADGGRYRVADLACLVEAREAPHAGVLVSLATAATTAIGVIAAAILAQSSTPLVIGVIAVVVPAGAALVCAYLWPPVNSLRARYHGFDVQLFQSRDETTFRKVARALLRAREIGQNGPHSADA
jgi:hypothetical protein